MLFYAKRHARISAPVMIALVILSNLWAGLRDLPLGDAVFLDLRSLVVILLGVTLVTSLDSVIYLVNWIIGFRPFLNAFDKAFEILFARVSFPAVIAGGLLGGLIAAILSRTTPQARTASVTPAARQV